MTPLCSSGRRRLLPSPVTECGDYAEIGLKNGGKALIDIADTSLVRGLRWTENGCKKRYAITYFEGEKFYLHRVIANPDGGLTVDHINGDTLDNRRANLRVCRFIDNSRNKMKHKGGTSSCFKGVHYVARSNFWRARIVANGRPISLGVYKTELEAALAWDDGAKKYHGMFARLNFPKGKPAYWGDYI